MLIDEGMEESAKALRNRMADEMAGQVPDAGWEAALREVPRHWFLDGFYTDGGRSQRGMTVWEPSAPDMDPVRWLRKIYGNETLITQFDEREPDWGAPAPRVGGAPTSSSTLPSLVLAMWGDADLAGDQAVLEVGTGTGYSTALYSHRYGSRRLTSIDVDCGRLERAAAGLHRLGYGPRLAVADGLYGYAPYAPYDRIVAACSVRHIPGFWLDQIRPGGKILATLGGWLNGSARVLMTRHDDGSFSGRLLAGTISFMLARAHERVRFGDPHHWAMLLGEAKPRETRHSPDRLASRDAEIFHGVFIAQLAAPNVQEAHVAETTVLVDAVSGSVAALSADGDGWQVRETGPVRIWSRIESAFDAWDAAGRPGPERFGLRIDDAGQHVELDGGGLSFPLPFSV